MGSNPANPFHGRATGAAQFDSGEARRALAVLADPGHAVELRGLPSGRSYVRDGRDLDGLAEAAGRLAGDRGVYFTLNPLSMEAGYDRAARAADVVRRRWLLVDVDPVRPRDSSSTEAEHDAARELAHVVLDWLCARGWPLPAQVDSGNGWHLLYRVDLPADEDSRALLRGCLQALATRFDTPAAVIDRSVHNAARISKLPGTWARKGAHTPDRPHRMARLWRCPERLEPVPRALLEALAGEVRPAPQPSAVAPPAANGHAAGPFSGKAAGKTAAYARAALEGEARAVRAAPEGGRNVQLNDSAFALGQLVGAGLLDRGEAEAALAAAARDAGLDEREIAATLRSGLDGGIGSPRKADVPAPAASAPSPEDVESAAVSADDVATIDDLIRAGAEITWLWPGWVQTGVLTLLASEGGVGKTRFCADLLRRVRHGLSWPDGSSMQAPPDSLALWVVSDNHHDEMVTLTQAFGIKDSVRINAGRADPYGGVTLDDAKELIALEARVKAVRPALVIIDTIGNATDRNLSRQEDAKMFFQPLQIIARRNRVAVVCVTHLNAAGAVLGRRATEKVRVVLRLERPDPENQPNRRRLEVLKSNSKTPPPLGVTMGDHGNDYDHSPPERAPERGPAAAPRGPRPAVREAMEWLAARLPPGLPRRVGITRNEAEEAGISAPALYEAKRLLYIEEFELEGKKWWRLPSKSD